MFYKSGNQISSSHFKGEPLATYVADQVLVRVDAKLVHSVGTGLTSDGDLGVVDHLIGTGIGGVGRSKVEDSLDQVVVVVLVVVHLHVIVVVLGLGLVLLFLAPVLSLGGGDGGSEGREGKEGEGRETHSIEIELRFCGLG